MSLLVSCRNGIACRMYIIGALAVAAVAALAAVSIHFARLTSEAAQVLYGHSLAGVVEATELELLMAQHRRVIEAVRLAPDRYPLHRQQQMSEDVVQRIERLVTPPGDNLAEQIAENLPELVRLGRDAQRLAGTPVQQDAMASVDAYARTADRMQESIRLFRLERVGIAEMELQALATNARRLVNWVSTLALAALLLIGPLSLVLIRNVVLRLRDITQAMVRLARNDTGVVIQAVSRLDEISHMARAVQVFKTNAIMLLDQKARLEQLNLWLDIALNNMARGLSMFDAREQLVVCNSNYLRMYGLPAECARPGTRFDDILRRRMASVISSVDGDGWAAEHDKVRAAVAKVVGLRQESRFSQTLQDGRIIEVSMRPLETGGWVAVHEDVTEQRRASAHIARLAHLDTLTGLANRLQFRERLEELARGLPAREFVLHCIDLDRFKEVNDTLGHPVGDALLKSVARRLEATVRATDVVARLGGDEFAVLQTGTTSRGDAAVLACRLIDAVSAPVQIQGHRIEVGATIGIAHAPNDGDTPDVLLRNADMALYRGKSAGRGRLSFFDTGMEGQLRTRRLVESDLQRAVSERQFELYYQPIVSLVEARVAGCEALIRWRHPERGMISPAEFIPVAEDIGLIAEIGA